MQRRQIGLARRAAQGNAHDELRVPFHTAGEALGRSRTEREAELARFWMVDGPLGETTNQINGRGERVPAQVIRHPIQMIGQRRWGEDDDIERRCGPLGAAVPPQNGAPGHHRRRRARRTLATQPNDNFAMEGVLAQPAELPSTRQPVSPSRSPPAIRLWPTGVKQLFKNASVIAAKVLGPLSADVNLGDEKQPRQLGRVDIVAKETCDTGDNDGPLGFDLPALVTAESPTLDAQKPGCLYLTEAQLPAAAKQRLADVLHVGVFIHRRA